MKLRKINTLIAIAFGTAILLTGCSKDDGAIPKRIHIEDVPAVSMNTKTGGTTGTITLANQAAFLGEFGASMYFSNQVAPAKVDIVVRKNGSVNNVKMFKTGIATLPAAFTVTAAEIATLFGTPLALNDTYDFAPNLYVGTLMYEAFPAVGNGVGQSIPSMNNLGFGEYVRYTVK